MVKANLIAEHAAIEVNSAWSSNGKGLVFASDRDQGFELYLLKLADRTLSQLTVSLGDNTQPSAARR